MAMTADESQYQSETSEDASDAYSLSNYEIITSPNDFNIKTLVDHIKNGNIIIPNFQRNYVWSLKQASGLIESIIVGLPIPQIFIFEETSGAKTRYLVIDGQQRLMSIFYFVMERFPKKNQQNLAIFDIDPFSFNADTLKNNSEYEDFKLKLPPVTPGETSKHHGKKYSDLDTFDMRTIRCILVRQTRPAGNAAMYEIFRRLNTAGENLKAQEIRKCVYDSPFYNMLYGINKNAKWRSLIGEKFPNNRMRDVEMLLRGFAMLDKGDEYTPSLTGFLNKFSDDAKKFNDKKVTRFKKLFESFLANNKWTTAHFSNEQNKISPPIFESVFAAVCRRAYQNAKTDADKIDIRLLDKLKNNPDFKKAIERQTSSKKNVQKRLKLARDILVAKPASRIRQGAGGN